MAVFVICTMLRLEGDNVMSHLCAQTGHHVIQHMIWLKHQTIRQQLEGQVPIPKMVGNSHQQLYRICSHHRHRLRLRLDKVKATLGIF
jgi:hypothetical protein